MLHLALNTGLTSSIDWLPSSHCTRQGATGWCLLYNRLFKSTMHKFLSLAEHLWNNCNPTAVFSTRVPSQQYTEGCVSGFDCSDVQLRSWNLSTQLDKDKSRFILLPLHLYDHYEKEIFWLGDALLSAPDYRCLLAFSHPELICISELSNCVSLKSEQTRICQRWVNISTTKIPPQKNSTFFKLSFAVNISGLGLQL